MKFNDLSNVHPSGYCNGCAKQCYINSSTDEPSLTSRASINYRTIYSIQQNNKIIFPVFRAPHLARKFAWQLAKLCVQSKKQKTQ